VRDVPTRVEEFGWAQVARLRSRQEITTRSAVSPTYGSDTRYLDAAQRPT
jgi:hypothetical protein